jgi:hypothetical protein
MLIALGCATRVQVPPRVELADWSTIGIVGFDSRAHPELAELVTGQFLQMLHGAQPGARLLELGPEGRLLAEVGHRRLDFEAVRALGERYGVDAVFTGVLDVSELKPDVRLGQALNSVRASANVNGTLATKLLETRSGAAVWSRSARASANVARIGASAGGGLPSFRVGDPSDAYAGLVPQLVDQLSGDFHPTWTRQR